MSREKMLFAYIRVSTEKQVEKNLSLPKQIELAEEYAKDNNLEITILEDAGLSAYDSSPDSRPAFSKLLENISEGKTKYIWIWNFNRLAREQAASSALLHAIHSSSSSDIQIIQGDSGKVLEFNTAEATFLFSMVNYQTVKASEDFKKQMRRGHNSFLKNGGFPSPTAPYGYDQQPKTRLLSINREEAKIVKEIFRLRINERLGYMSIADALNDRGIKPKYKIPRALKAGVNNRLVEGKTSGKWEKSSIRNILLNELYTGKRTIYNYNWKKHNGEKKLKSKEVLIELDVPHLQIIDIETYEKAQKINLGSPAISNRGTYDSLLKGLIYCGDCGNSVRPNISPNRGSYIYRCTHNRNTYNTRIDRCWSKAMNITMVNDLVYDALRSTETYHKVIKDIFNDDLTIEELSKLKEREKKILKDTGKIKKAITLHKDLFAMQHHTPEEYNIAHKDCTNKLLKLKIEMSNVQTAIKYLTDQKGHTAQSKRLVVKIKEKLDKVETLYSATRLHYKNNSNPYFNAMKSIFNAIVNQVELKYHDDHKVHELKIDFNTPTVAMERLENIPAFDKIEVPEVDYEKFIQNTINKVNPIENRGLIVNHINGTLEDFNVTKEETIEVIEKFSAPKLIGNRLNGIEKLIGLPVPEQYHRDVLPTIKVIYKYTLSKHRKKVEKLVLYTNKWHVTQ